MKSASQIYRKKIKPFSKKGISFKDWINWEKNIYNKRKENHKVTLEFEDYLKKKYRMVKDNYFLFAEDGVWNWIQENIKEAADVADNLGRIDDNTGSGAVNDSVGNGGKKPPKEDNKRILGLKRPVAIGAGIVILVGVSVLVYNMVSKSKK